MVEEPKPWQYVSDVFGSSELTENTVKSMRNLAKHGLPLPLSMQRRLVELVSGKLERPGRRCSACDGDGWRLWFGWRRQCRFCRGTGIDKELEQ